MFDTCWGPPLLSVSPQYRSACQGRYCMIGNIYRIPTFVKKFAALVLRRYFNPRKRYPPVLQSTLRLQRNFCIHLHMLSIPMIWITYSALLSPSNSFLLMSLGQARPNRVLNNVPTTPSPLSVSMTSKNSTESLSTSPFLVCPVWTALNHKKIRYQNYPILSGVIQSDHILHQFTGSSSSRSSIWDGEGMFSQ